MMGGGNKTCNVYVHSPPHSSIEQQDTRKLSHQATMELQPFKEATNHTQVSEHTADKGTKLPKPKDLTYCITPVAVCACVRVSLMPSCQQQQQQQVQHHGSLCVCDLQYIISPRTPSYLIYKTDQCRTSWKLVGFLI